MMAGEREARSSILLTSRKRSNGTAKVSLRGGIREHRGRPVAADDVVKSVLNRDKKAIEDFIDANLQPLQIEWLTTESQAAGCSRTRLFEAVLADWLSRCPSQSHRSAVDDDIACQAVDEIILRFS